MPSLLPSSAAEAPEESAAKVLTAGDAFEFKAAIVLHNMAVSMMERCCYFQAFQTFRDAIYALRIATTAERQQHRDELRQSLLSMIKQARNRASTPEVVPAEFRMPIAVVSHSHPKTPFYRKTNEFLLEPTCYTIIRIEAEDSDLLGARFDDDQHEYCSHHHGWHMESQTATGLHDDKHNVATSIFLYNFGIAHLCRARQNYQPNQRSLFSLQLHTGGIKLLSYSRSLLEHVINESYSSRDDPFFLYTLVLLSIGVTEALADALQAQGQMEDAQACSSDLLALRAMASNLTRDSSILRNIQTKVAPAA